MNWLKRVSKWFVPAKYCVDEPEHFLHSYGWTAWAMDPPPKGAVVEIMRLEWIQSAMISVSDADPKMDQFGLYWRPASRIL